jgi:hypothetical protein
MVNPQDATEVVPYLTSAATIYFIQQQLKQLAAYRTFVQTFPGADKWAHWLVAGLMSAGAAAGIHIVWTCSLCSVWDPNKGGDALVHVPSVFDLMHGLSDWWKVFVLQQATYRMADGRPAPAAPIPHSEGQ